jgi:hypothetical protein
MKMTRQPHDQYSKEALLEILAFFGGKAEGQRFIHPKEVYYADISFEPPPTLSETDLEKVGVLGDMITTPCLIEYFWTPPTRMETRLCLMKLFSWHGDILREAKRKKKEMDEKNPQQVKNLQEILPKVLPKLWILTTSASQEFLASFDVKASQPKWCKGFYFMGVAMNTGIVVIDELPETLETVWLRILGTDKTQQKAIETFATLKDKGLLLDNVLDVFYKWHEDTKAQDNLTPEDKELLMTLSPAYEKSRHQAILEGMQIGLLLGLQQSLQSESRHLDKQLIEYLLKLRFGVDEALSQLIEPLVQMPPKESLQLLMQCSREDLLAQFNQ